MVEVEKGTLRTLEEDFLSPGERIVQVDDRVGDEGLQPRAGLQVGSFHLFEGQRLRAERAQNLVGLAQPHLELGREHGGLHEVGHP